MMAIIVGFRIMACRVMTRTARLPATSAHVLMSQTCLDNKERCINSRSALHSPPKRRISGCGNLIPSPSESGSQTKFASSFNSRSGDEITYSEFQKRVHPDDRAARDRVMQRAIRTHGSYETEYRIMLPDGTVRWIGGRARCCRR